MSLLLYKYSNIPLLSSSHSTYIFAPPPTFFSSSQLSLVVSFQSRKLFCLIFLLYSLLEPNPESPRTKTCSSPTAKIPHLLSISALKLICALNCSFSIPHSFKQVMPFSKKPLTASSNYSFLYFINMLWYSCNIQFHTTLSLFKDLPSLQTLS